MVVNEVAALIDIMLLMNELEAAKVEGFDQPAEASGTDLLIAQRDPSLGRRGLGGVRLKVDAAGLVPGPGCCCQTQPGVVAWFVCHAELIKSALSEGGL